MQGFYKAMAISVMLATGAEAQESCKPEFQAQKLQLTSATAAASKLSRRLQARIDGQDLRIGELDPAIGARLPAAPDLPAIPSFDLGADKGCSAPLTEELDQIEKIKAQLDKAGAALEARETALADAQAGKTAAESEDPVAEVPAVDSPEAPAPGDAEADDPEPGRTDGAAQQEAGDATDGASPSVSEQAPQDQSAQDTEESPETSDSASETAASPDASATPSDAGDAVAQGAAPKAAEPVAPAPQDAAVAPPMTVPDNPELFQRVLSLPSMQIHDAPGIIENGQSLAAFSVLYVFERRDLGGETWLSVGTALNQPPAGWARAADSVDWSSMLVMQFAPRGKRNRVLFYGEEGPLKDIVSSPFRQAKAKEIYDQVAEERRKQAADSAYQPQWNADLVAIEPDTAVRYDDRPYLLPILDWRQEMFDGTVDTTMVKVAALPAKPEGAIGARDDASFSTSAGDAALNDDEFRVGVVFVVDTTVSMRPFIERTYDAIDGFYNAFSKFESAQYISFGLVGFRDTVETDPERLEYVTRNFQPLDPSAPPESILRNMRTISEAGVSNLGFEEDAIAGLVDAIDENDWAPFDARLIILVTDASARTDGKAKYPDMTIERLREKARNQNITIIPIHLLTPANDKAGDAGRAREQFEALAQTGDLAENKYMPLNATTDEGFAQELNDMARTIAANVMRANSGEVLRDDLMEPMPEVAPETGSEPAPAPGESREAPSAGRLSEIVDNEIFRAQLESLGRVEGSAAPAFMAGWAADRDMTNPDVETLEVSVYLTRNQLSTLDKRLESIIEAFRSGGQDPQAFFANLQLLAAQTATDPDSVRQGDRATIEAILPGFLKSLPYRSQVLRLDQSYWASMSVSQQQEFIENLEAKRKVYADLFGETGIWADFGAGDPGLEATPVRLVNLP